MRVWHGERRDGNLGCSQANTRGRCVAPSMRDYQRSEDARYPNWDECGPTRRLLSTAQSRRLGPDRIGMEGLSSLSDFGRRQCQNKNGFLVPLGSPGYAPGRPVFLGRPRRILGAPGEVSATSMVLAGFIATLEVDRFAPSGTVA